MKKACCSISVSEGGVLCATGTATLSVARVWLVAAVRAVGAVEAASDGEFVNWRTAAHVSSARWGRASGLVGLVEANRVGATEVATWAIDGIATVFVDTVGVLAAAPGSVCCSEVPVRPVVREPPMFRSVLVGRGCATALVVVAGVSVRDSPDFFVAVDPACRESAERDPVEVVVAEDTLPPLEDTVLRGDVWRVV